MSGVDQNTNFDSLFILAEADENLSAKQQCHTVVKENQTPLVTATNKMANLHLAGHKQGSRGCMTPGGGSRGGSGHGSRGSPARKQTKMTLCPSNPAVLGSAATRSHSMRDQTSHMKEKYQVTFSIYVWLHNNIQVFKLISLPFTKFLVTYLQIILCQTEAKLASLEFLFPPN